MSEPFGYTDKQWSEVARELPMGADHGKVRRLLERLGDGGLVGQRLKLRSLRQEE
jgi:hypothetical protein